MQHKDTVTGLTVGLLALQVFIQGLMAYVTTLFSDYEERVQTFDGLAEAPILSLFVLLIVGFGIFRTLRLSLLVTLCMLLPFIDAAIALGHDTNHWDGDSPGKLQTVEAAITRLIVIKYAVWAGIAAVAAWAIFRARAKATERMLQPVTP